MQSRAFNGARAGAVHEGCGPRVHVVVSTHTTRHLIPCLSSLARQTVSPGSVVVSSDTDSPEIERALRRWWPEIARVMRAGELRVPRLLYTSRAHQGEARPAQVRNNGLRALDGQGLLEDSDLIVGLDGDMVLTEPALEQHLSLVAAGVEVTIPYRANLDEALTGRMAPEAILERRDPAAGPLASLVSASEWAGIRRRHRRYRLYATARRMPGGSVLVKAHKPKILSAHYAVSVRALRAINGFDERFSGWGFEDDDLARRLHGLRPKPRLRIAVRDILALHLWHPTRSPGDRRETPEYAHFHRRRCPVFAELGWSNPAPQPDPQVRAVPAEVDTLADGARAPDVLSRRETRA